MATLRFTEPTHSTTLSLSSPAAEATSPQPHGPPQRYRPACGENQALTCRGRGSSVRKRRSSITWLVDFENLVDKDWPSELFAKIKVALWAPPSGPRTICILYGPCGDGGCIVCIPGEEMSGGSSPGMTPDGTSDLRGYNHGDLFSSAKHPSFYHYQITYYGAQP